MPFEGQPIHLTPAHRTELEEIAGSHALAARFVQRARIVLLLADGTSARAASGQLDVSRPTIAKWRQRFLDGGVDALTSYHPGRTPWKLTGRVRARVLAATRRPPPDGKRRWSCRRLAAHLGVSKDVVQRVWREADLPPHGLARLLPSARNRQKLDSGRPQDVVVAGGIVKPTACACAHRRQGASLRSAPAPRG